MKIKNKLYNHIKYNEFSAIIAMIIMILIIVWSKYTGKRIELIDWTIFATLVATLLLKIIAGGIKSRILNWLEDSAKLTENYGDLSSKYKNKQITYDNSKASKDNQRLIDRLKMDKQVTIPVICDYKLEGYDVIVIDSKKDYELPEIIKEHFDEIIEAHSTFDIYNQLNVRVDNWKVREGKFIIETSRTSYYNSLVTNRAMDFKWKNKVSIRDLFEYSPYLNTLNGPMSRFSTS